MGRREDPIGVFDSGVGGISTLGAMARLLPGERFIYFGDAKNAPYGTKTTEEVQACVWDVVRELEKDRIKALVIACNTATGAAAGALRARLDIPVIGIEPALKPAYDANKKGSILVMATPLTLHQEKFENLMARYGEHAVPLSCPGLMELVEQEDEEGAKAYLEKAFSAWNMRDVAAVVLGCTHYVFLRPVIRAMLPAHVMVTDGNAGTARQLRRVLEARDLLREGEDGGIELRTSGEEEKILPVMRRLLDRSKDLSGEI